MKMLLSLTIFLCLGCASKPVNVIEADASVSKREYVVPQSGQYVIKE
ncbi:MAG: hypothetical protein AAFV69_00165 [Pseudomonadota bacterium]